MLHRMADRRVANAARSLHVHAGRMYQTSTAQHKNISSHRIATVAVAGTAIAAFIADYKGYHLHHYIICKLSDPIIVPMMRNLLNPETAHSFAVFCAAHNLIPKDSSIDSDMLMVQALHQTFPNPIGMAAGFDKDGIAIEGVLDCGFGFVEIGSVTPEPQEGNAKPRVFRLIEDEAIINRYGFNSKGLDFVRSELMFYKRKKANGWGKRSEDRYIGHRPGVLGVNLGKNKLTKDAAEDYVRGILSLGEYADYLVINVSSPNTPGLRALQGKEELEELLARVLQARDMIAMRVERKIPLLLKIAPDLSEQDKVDIAHVALEKKLDGLIVSNTTLQRPSSLQSLDREEQGGLSGIPLRELSTQVLGDMYKLTRGEILLIGVGGVSSGKDAYEKIKAGATLVQMYSCLIYKGPAAVVELKKELEDLLKADGFRHVTEAIGSAHLGKPCSPKG